jgi:hypothetical protein
MIPWSLIRPLAAPIAISILAAGGAWYAHSSGARSGMAATQARWDAEKVLVLEAKGEQILKAQGIETELKAKMAQLKEGQRRETTRIAAGYQRTIDSLRDRPEARAGASGVPEGAAPGAGCTGAGLARPDAAFLAGYGADAARLQSALEVCQAAYDSLTR